MQPIVNIHTHHPQPGELTPQTEGIHPWSAEQWDGEIPALLPECEAVGEIGLDYACGVDRLRQEELFRAQLQLACTQRLPVVLHCVRAFEPTMRILGDYRLQQVIFHGFIGSWQQAEQALKEGYFLSFGERSFRSPRTVETMRHTPLERLFLESDESPTPIGEIYRQAAGLLNLEPVYLKHIIRSNFKQIFRR